MMFADWLIFDASDFPARWHCGNWSEMLGWTHIVSDLLIWAAYYAIPLLTGYYLFQTQRAGRFRRLFPLFAAYMLLCGTSHLMESIIFWWPAYRLLAVVKVCMAIVSWAAVIALIGIVPRALTLRSSEELEREVAERRRTEAALRDTLERLRGILSQAVDGIITIDDHGKIEAINPAAEKMFGYASGELIGRNVSELMPEPHRGTHDSYLREYRETGRRRVVGSTLEITGIRSDGILIPLEVSVGEALLSDGRVILTGFVRDLTSFKRADSALRQSEQKFRAIFDQTFHFIGLLSPDGVVLEANRTALEAIGDVGDSFRGLYFWDTRWWSHDEAQRERLREAVQRAAAGETVRFEASHPGADGTLIWVDFSLKPVRDEYGVVTLLIPEGRDITDRKQTELALLASQERFELAVRGSRDGIWDWDMRNNEVYFSPRWKEMLGYGEHEVEGRFSEWERLVHPDDLQAIQNVINDYGAGRIPIYEVEFRMKTRDGGWRWILSRGLAIRDSAGSPVRMAGSHTDVTDRHAAAEALHENQTRLAMALKAAGAGTWSLVGTKFFPSDRAALMHGLDPDRDIDRNGFLARVHDEDRKRIEIAPQNQTHPTQPFRDEYRVPLPEGGERWLASSAERQVGPKGTRLLGLVQDVSSRKMIEESLRSSLREKEVLLKEIHHRVKNNLAITVSLFKLQMRNMKDGSGRDALLQAQDRVRSMAVVHEMLYNSNSFTEVDLPGYIGKLVRGMASGYSTGERVRTELDVEATSLSLESAVPFGLILNELVSNAFKYAFPEDRRGILAVSLHRTSDRNLTLEVRDDGPGLPTGFNPFETRSLGLRLVRDLVAQIGGGMRIESGEGTVFRVTFPSSNGGRS